LERGGSSLDVLEVAGDKSERLLLRNDTGERGDPKKLTSPHPDTSTLKKGMR